MVQLAEESVFCIAAHPLPNPPPQGGRGSLTSQQKQRLRFWLALLKLSRGIETELRERFKADFGTTLPRFDVMAALDRHKKGLKMSELSKVLKVSNGNVTGIVDRLERDKCLERVAVTGDRRAWLVRLTAKGRKAFAVMAAAHEGWVDTILHKLEPDEAAEMIATFQRLSRKAGDSE